MRCPEIEIRKELETSNAFRRGAQKTCQLHTCSAVEVNIADRGLVCKERYKHLSKAACVCLLVNAVSPSLKNVNVS